MALEVIGEAVLSASLKALFGDISSIVDFVRRNKVDEDLLNQLNRKLSLANDVLDDAERQQVTNPRVRQWLEHLEDAIHDAEDLVDQIKTEALRRELEADHRIRRRVRNFFSSRRNFFSSRLTVKDVEHRIKKIIGSVDEIVRDMETLDLKKGVHTTTPFQIQRVARNFLVNESDVYGREAEKEAIIKFLSSDGADGDHNVSVMAIVGMGGMGKTTLAQLVFNMINDKVEFKEKPFVIKAWITVSDESDVFTLTKVIYEKVIGNVGDSNTVKEAFELQLKLEEALKDKKLLFVFDDVWNVDYQLWKDLIKPLEFAASGSKIILTTRLLNIAKVVTADSEVLNLALLSETNCWKLFSKLAFNNVESSSYSPDLVKIGEKLVKKCQGNPLAIKSLACFLHDNLKVRHWEEVLENDLWDLIPQKKDGILTALWLSYFYLPCHLKRCFIFCSIFPKDFAFKKETLILLWMAEGFLQTQNNMELEDVGEKYFEELTSRSFFDVTQYGIFTMHDLVNDLAKFVSRNSCLRLDYDKLSDKNLIRKTRHISYISITQEIRDKISKGLFENKVLRSVFDLNVWGGHVTQFIENSKQLASMHCLRVLCLRDTFSKHGGFSLESIGKLKLLRYLDFSKNDGIDEMPDTICTLYNLQTLLLRSCGNLVRLPNSIEKLRHLKHLDLSDTAIRRLPDTIGKLRLRHLDLSDTAITRLPDTIGELRHLRHLDLSNIRIERLPDTIGNLQELRVLRLFNYSYRLSSDSCGCWITHLPATITSLTNLRELDVSGIRLEEMPRGMSSLKNLQKLGKFTVGKNSGSGIEELGNLQHLSGDLEITGLENVAEVNDVSNGCLENARDIRRLYLLWNRYHSDDDNKAIEVLDRLRPHPNIEHLRICNYGGRSFPDWVGLHSFSRITCLKLHHGKRCRQLPPLGELPSLEQLEIEGFDMVERIGDEFCVAASSSSPSSSSSSRGTELSFKSLKELRFADMPEWKEWSSSLVGIAFSNLEVLELRSCPKLRGACCLPGSLPSLKHLEICSNLLDSLARCDCPSLRHLEVRDCSEMKSFPQARLPESIESIRLSGCRELESFSEEGWPCSSLKSLVIGGCGNLFAHNSSNTNKWNLRMLTSLTDLSILHVDVGGMGSFPEEEGQLPTSLTSLDLLALENFKSLNGTAFRHLTSLTSLSIMYMDMGSFPEEEGQLPTTLTSLLLQTLGNLKSLNGTAFRHLTSLQKLTIAQCHQLECLPQERLPASLSELRISNCRLLSPRCQRDKGQDWDKIDHIPRIIIDFKNI